MNLPAALGGILVLAVVIPAPARGADTARILERYEELRPSKEDLAMYRLDWEPSLEKALARAEEEERPVFLVLIHAKYGDIFSGHC